MPLRIAARFAALFAAEVSTKQAHAPTCKLLVNSSLDDLFLLERKEPFVRSQYARRDFILRYQGISRPARIPGDDIGPTAKSLLRI